MDSIQTMLDYRDLSERYRNAPTMQGTPMLDNFFTGATATTADEVEFYTVGRTDKPNPMNTRGSMPQRQAGAGATKKKYALFHSFNELSMDVNTLRFLRSNDPAIQAMGRQWVADTIEEEGRRQKLTREVAIGQIMTGGRVCYDVNGMPVVYSIHATTGVITNGAGVQVSADFQVPDTRRGRCDQSGAGSDYVFSGAWDTAATDIFAELEKCRDRAIKAGSEAPTDVYIHRQRIPQLMLNTQFQLWAKHNNVSNESVIARGQIDNFFGWNFKTLEGYWTDAGGTQRPVIPFRQAIIVPPAGGWKRCKEGTQDVPTTIELKSGLDEALATLKPVVGMFGFSQVKVSPLVQCSLYLGDNFGMGFANPNSPWFPTVFAA